MKTQVARYRLTAAGRARLRTDRRFRAALIAVLLRSEPLPSANVAAPLQI